MIVTILVLQIIILLAIAAEKIGNIFWGSKHIDVLREENRFLKSKIPKASEYDAELEFFRKSHQNKLDLINQEKERIAKVLEESAHNQAKVAIESIKMFAEIIRPKLEKLAEYEKKEYELKAAYTTAMKQTYSLGDFLNDQEEKNKSAKIGDILNLKE